MVIDNEMPLPINARPAIYIPILILAEFTIAPAIYNHEKPSKQQFGRDLH
jgi:hypothetical protein